MQGKGSAKVDSVASTIALLGIAFVLDNPVSALKPPPLAITDFGLGWVIRIRFPANKQGTAHV